MLIYLIYNILISFLLQQEAVLLNRDRMTQLSLEILTLQKEGLAVARIARDHGSSSTNRSSDGYH